MERLYIKLLDFNYPQRIATVELNAKAKIHKRIRKPPPTIIKLPIPGLFFLILKNAPPEINPIPPRRNEKLTSVFFRFSPAIGSKS